MIPVHIPKKKRKGLEYHKWTKSDTKWSLIILFIIAPLWWLFWYVIYGL